MRAEVPFPSPLLFLLLLLTLLLTLLPSLSSSKPVTIHNDQPRLDTNGNIVNAHDGGVYQFPDMGYPHTFFLYGTVYENCHQNSSQCRPPCGYNPNRFALYVSNDLISWELWSDNVLPEVARDNQQVNYWMPNVGRNPTTGMYVMNYWSSHCGFSKPCTELALSSSPYGPFKMLTSPVPLSFVPSSQMGLFVDGPDAYIKYNTGPPEQHHAIQKLSPDWSTTEGEGGAWPIFWKPSFPWNEGGGMFKRGSLYYYMTGSDCCFCQWGGDAKVWTAYHPLGPWHPGLAPKPPKNNTLCDLAGDWVCWDGVNGDGKCTEPTIRVTQKNDTIVFDRGTATVLKNGYILTTASPNEQPGVVTSADGKSFGCDRIRWYGDESAYWCRVGKKCSPPSSYMDPVEVNFCQGGGLPAEGVRNNPCDPKNPLFGKNFTVPAQQFNVIQVTPSSSPTPSPSPFPSFLYYGERSMSAPDGLKSHNFQAWVPLQFDEDGGILPLTFPKSFDVEI